MRVDQKCEKERMVMFGCIVDQVKSNHGRCDWLVVKDLENDEENKNG